MVVQPVTILKTTELYTLKLELYDMWTKSQLKKITWTSTVTLGTNTYPVIEYLHYTSEQTETKESCPDL